MTLYNVLGSAKKINNYVARKEYILMERNVMRVRKEQNLTGLFITVNIYICKKNQKLSRVPS